MSDGLIYIFTGEGKGKTSAALGVAMRALLIDQQVIWIAFYKEESWGMAEKGMRGKFDNLEMIFAGRGFRIGKKTAPVGNKGHVVVDKATEDDHKRAAEDGLQHVVESLGKKPFLLVMDEVLNAIDDGLLEERQVRRVVAARDETHIILTGRGASARMIQEADLVTECRKVKHPYDTGKLAVRGLDF